MIRSKLAQTKKTAEWRSLIIETLGGEGWNVELDDQNLDHAIWQTLALFNKYTPKWKRVPLGQVDTAPNPDNTENNTSVFDFSEEEEGTRVVDVTYLKDGNDYSQGSSSLSQCHYYRYGGMRGPRKIFQLYAAQDRYEHLVGGKPAFRWDEETRRLFLSVPFGAKLEALLLVPYTADTIPAKWNYDFLDCAVGHAKLILGRKNRKLGDIPAAQGDISLDSAELTSEGREAVDRVERKLDRALHSKLPMRTME